MNRATVRDLQGGSSVTAADRAIGMLLREALPEDEAGWLSEKSPDGDARLQCDRVWGVDPIDGTRSLADRHCTGHHNCTVARLLR